MLIDAYKNLSQRYKNQKTHIPTDETRLAYVNARLPATYAVVCAVVERLLQEQNIAPPQTVLDLGSGPGTVILALEDIFENPITATLIERDPGFIDIAKTLLKNEYTHICADIIKTDYSAHDWVIASYALNELVKKESFILKAFQAANDFFIIIEPGTPQGFENILEARNIILQNGGHILLPCPHQFVCPNTWCHFSQRLSRSKLHKSIKNASLGYEDEKYAYLIASKVPPLKRNPRIVSTPRKHSGHIDLSLCMPNGTLEDKTFSKSKCEDFKEIKKKEWGDNFLI